MEASKNVSVVESVNKELNKELTKETASALLATTFKGLTAPSMKQALMEGMVRGFKFKDFLEKNVYAIPFGTGYSLITSIDYARKIGARSGVVGIESPIYTEDEKGNIITCTITVKKKTDEHIGDYSATVYFNEYTTRKNQWISKPRTMIAKVAEMHALRKACPEELSQQYVEEEIIEPKTINVEVKNVIPRELVEKVENATTEAELKAIWEENKGLGKEFASMITKQKEFILSVKKDEKDDQAS